MPVVATVNWLRVSPLSRDRGTISVHARSASSSGLGYPSTDTASTEHCSGKLPVKNAVSTITLRITPGTPSRTIAQS